MANFSPHERIRADPAHYRVSIRRNVARGPETQGHSHPLPIAADLFLDRRPGQWLATELNRVVQRLENAVSNASANFPKNAP